jgi:maltose alpha-D-glucosyltransferase/alpha-amylase
MVESDPLWYKDAIIYELHVRAFCDSNADGIGDFRGLVEKLDYLQDLGVTTLWLLPFYPSPLRDDGYDIADYTDINRIYGSLADFKVFLREAHERGLRVITELVVNHTSDQHAWFQRARRSPPGSSWRDFYVWSDTTDRFQEARIIFSDFEPSNWSWDTVAKAYYWHRFFGHQPDLNFDNPVVHDAVFSVLDFWLNLGIDGLRLDAVPYLYEREGTNCENLAETHAFLKKLRRHVDDKFRNRMLLAEANQWPEDAVAYFGHGDECQMCFHFPLMPRLFMAIRMEDRFPVIDILQQTPQIPDNSQWALFLRNHDELTLEMVTAEDRDYMYRVYAQESHARVNLGIRRRLAPLLENHRGKIELMNALLFSLPGTPVLYYGDEIGMGDNVYLGDRNGVRTPMQWNPERNAGFSRANPQRLYLPVIIDPEYHYQTINVEAQQNNQHSLLWWMKRLIALRKRTHAFGRGSLEFLTPSNHKVLVFLRRYHDERILVVANLSRFVQYVELDLAAWRGMVPVEMLGRMALPAIGDQPYLLTLGPYAFYWLSLEAKAATYPLLATVEGRLPMLAVNTTWANVFQDRSRESLERIILLYLRGQHWFALHGGQSKLARIVEQISIPTNTAVNFITLVQVEYADGEPKTFVLPLAFAPDPEGQQVQQTKPQAVICRLQVKRDNGSKESQGGCLYDPIGAKPFAAALLESIARHRRYRGTRGELLAWPTPAMEPLRGTGASPPEPSLFDEEQSNTSVLYGDRYVLKLFRWVEEGSHPEVELGRALAEKVGFEHSAPVAGSLTYRAGHRQPMTLAVLLGYVDGQRDGWTYTSDALREYFLRVLIEKRNGPEPQLPTRPFLDLVGEELPSHVPESIGPYLESIRLLGRRTAEFHTALASIRDDADFAPEPFTGLYQRSLYQTVRTWVYRVFVLLRERARDLPEEARAEAQTLMNREADLVSHLRTIMDRKLSGQRIRCHGDFRLGSALFTGKDFVLIDFEGEVLRPLSNRRHKRSPLRDVASLLHSLYFAGRTALREGHLRTEDLPVLVPWARYWYVWTSAAFVKSYLEIATPAGFLPRAQEEIQVLLQFFLLGRGVFELRYQLLNRLDRAQIPLQAMLHLLELADRKTEAPPAAEQVNADQAGSTVKPSTHLSERAT